MKRKLLKYSSLAVLLILALYSLYFSFTTSMFVFSGEEINGIVKHQYYDQGSVENKTYVSASHKNAHATLDIPLIYRPTIDKNKETKIPVVYYEDNFYVGSKSTVAVLLVALLTMFLTSVSLFYNIITKKEPVSIGSKIAKILLIISIVLVVII